MSIQYRVRKLGDTDDRGLTVDAASIEEAVCAFAKVYYVRLQLCGITPPDVLYLSVNGTAVSLDRQDQFQQGF